MQAAQVDAETSDQQLYQSLSTTKRRRAASEPCEGDQAKRRKRSRGLVQPFSSFTNGSIQAIERRLSGHSNPFSESRKGTKFSVMCDMSATTCSVTSAKVIEDLTLELTCGCCTELCYNPVVVNPCQHFFCGGCCMMWIKNGGTNCPACRGPSTVVSPSRVLQSMLDLLLRFDPSKARTEADKAEADELYKAGTSFRLPTPRPPTPEPNIELPNDNFARPCPTCLAGNPFDWRCPVPIHDPIANPEHAFDLDEGTPVDHAFCGNCDQLHNIRAPNTTKCDFCHCSFCGIGVQDRCCALPLQDQQPHGYNELQDLILCTVLYDKFHGNNVEVDILLDYLRNNNVPLRRVYKEIVYHSTQQPQGFTSFIESGIFDDSYDGLLGEEPDPNATRRAICRFCAAKVLVHGLKDWWIRTRVLADLPEDVRARKDCSHGSNCSIQNDSTHCKEFNHIIGSEGSLREHAEQAPPSNPLLVPPTIPQPAATLPPQPPFPLPSPSRFGRFSLSDFLPPLPMPPLIRRGIAATSHENIPDMTIQTSRDHLGSSERQHPASDGYFSAVGTQNPDVCSNGLPASFSSYSSSTPDTQNVNEPMSIDASDGIILDPSYEGDIGRLKTMSHALLPML